MRLFILAILLLGLTSLATAQWPQGATEAAILVGAIGIPAFTILRSQYIMRTAVEETLAQFNASAFDSSPYHPPVALSVRTPPYIDFAPISAFCPDKSPLEDVFHLPSCSVDAFQTSAKQSQPVLPLFESIMESQAESTWWDDLLSLVGTLFHSFRFLVNDIYADVSRLFVFAVGFVGIRVGTALGLISFLLGLQYHCNKNGVRLRDAFIFWPCQWIYKRGAHGAVLLWSIVACPARTTVLQGWDMVGPLYKTVAVRVASEVIILVNLMLKVGKLCSQLASAAVDGYVKPAFDYLARPIFISQVVCWVFILALVVIVAASIGCMCILCCILLYMAILETFHFICKLIATLYRGLKLLLSDCWTGLTRIAPDVLHGIQELFGAFWYGLRSTSTSHLCPMVAHVDKYRAEMYALKNRQDQQDLRQREQDFRCLEQMRQIEVLTSEKRKLLAKLIESTHSHEELREYKALFQKLVHTGAVANVERLATAKQDGQHGPSFWRRYKHAGLTSEELEGKRLKMLRGEPIYALESAYFDKKEEVLALHGRDNVIEDRVNKVETAIEKALRSQEESDRRARELEKELDRLRKQKAPRATRQKMDPASIDLPPSPTTETKFESPKKGKSYPVEKVAGSRRPARQPSPAPRSSTHSISAASARPINQDVGISASAARTVEDTKAHDAAPAQPAKSIKISAASVQPIEDTKPLADVPAPPAKNVAGSCNKRPEVDSNHEPSPVLGSDPPPTAPAAPTAPVASSSCVPVVEQIDPVLEAAPAPQPAAVPSAVEEEDFIAGLRAEVAAAKERSSIQIVMDEDLCRLGSKIHGYGHLVDERRQGHLARFKKQFPGDHFERVEVSAQGHACGLRALFASWRAQFCHVKGYEYLTFEWIAAAAWLYMAANISFETNFGNDDLKMIMRDAIIIVSSDDALYGLTDLNEVGNLVLGAVIEGDNGAIIWNDENGPDKEQANNVLGQSKVSVLDHWSGLAPVKPSELPNAEKAIRPVIKRTSTEQSEATSGPGDKKQKKTVRFAEDLTTPLMPKPSTAADESAPPEQAAPVSIFGFPSIKEAPRITFELGAKPVEAVNFADLSSPFPTLSTGPKPGPILVAAAEQSTVAPAPVPVSNDVDMTDAFHPNLGGFDFAEPIAPTYNNVSMSDAPEDLQQSTAAPLQYLATPITQPTVAEVEMADSTPEVMPTKTTPAFTTKEVVMDDAIPRPHGVWDLKPPPKPKSTNFKLPSEVVMSDAVSQSHSGWDLKPPPKTASDLFKLPPKPMINTSNGLASSAWADNSIKKPVPKDADVVATPSSNGPTKSGDAATPALGGAKGKKSPFGRPQSETEKQNAIAEEMMNEFYSVFPMGDDTSFAPTESKPSTVLVPASPTKERVDTTPPDEFDFNQALPAAAADPTPAPFPKVKDQAAVDKCLADLKELERAIEAAQKDKPTDVKQQALPDFSSILLPPVPGPPAQGSKNGADNDVAAILSVPESPGKPRRVAQPKSKLAARDTAAEKSAASGPVGGAGNASTSPTTAAPATHGGVGPSLSLRGPYTAVDAGMPTSGTAFTNPFSKLGPSPFASAAAAVQTTAAPSTCGVDANASKSIFSDMPKYKLPKNFTFYADKSDSESEADSDGEDDDLDLKLAALREKAKARPPAVKKKRPRTIKQVGKEWAKKGFARTVGGDGAGETDMADYEEYLEMERALGEGLYND